MTRGSGMDDMPNQCQPKLKRNFNRTPPVADSFVAVEESYHVRIIEQQNLESSDLSKEKYKASYQSNNWTLPLKKVFI